MKSLIFLLRPHQWVKNLMLFFPPFLGGVLAGIEPGIAFASFASFSAAASMVYIINDLADVEQDRNHPRKKERPLASGRLDSRVAVLLIFVLGFLSAALAFLIPGPFIYYVIGYMGLSLVYSLQMKNVPLVELFCVVGGFLLRLLAGGAAFEVLISDWLLLSVFLLALFLVTGKRLSELRHEGGAEPARIRTVLDKYPDGFLESVMVLSGGAVLVTYTLYIISHQRSAWIIPICCFGLLAYLRRVYSGRGGDPTYALLREPMLLFSGFAWAIFVALEIYL